MTALAFERRSRIPGTKEWRQYREVVDWVDEAEATIRKFWGDDFPEFPKPIPRDPRALVVAVRTIIPILHATSSAAEGNVTGDELRAIIEEHRQ